MGVILLLSMVLLLLNFTTAASIYIEIPIDKQISNSVLIVKGVVIDKSSRYEEMVREFSARKNGVVNKSLVSSNTPYTTFTVQLDEILYGSYNKKVIAIKMEGGCGEDGKCLHVSSNYNYEIGDEIVVFLRYESINNIYVSADAGLTAYRVSPSNKLYRTGEYATFEKKSLMLNKENKKEILSLEELKAIIRDEFNGK